MNVATLAGRAVNACEGLRSYAVEVVLSGASNHVARVLCVDGQRVAVKNSHTHRERFRVEALVLQRAQEVTRLGQDVVGAVTIDDVLCLVTTWSSGRPLSDVTPLPPDVKASVENELVDELLCIHSVRMTGFGQLDALGCGSYPNFRAWFVTEAQGIAEIARSRAATHRMRALLTAASETIELAAGTVTSAPHLVHGDVSHRNLLIEDGRVSALVDWESAKSGHPGLEFGWMYFVGLAEHLDVDRMLTTYASRSQYAVSELRLIAYTTHVRVLLGHQLWQSSVGQRPDEEITANRLERALSDLVAVINGGR